MKKRSTTPNSGRSAAPTLKRPRQAPVEEEAMSEASGDTDDEQIKVRVGRVPYHWYDEFAHFGYDNKLTKVEKRKQLDRIEEFVQKSENKDWWRTVTDDLNNRDIVLTDAQLQLIDRIRSGKWASKTVATANYEFEFPHEDPFPVHAHPPAKRNFQPSKWERLKINRILDGILSGRIKPPTDEPEEPQEQELYDVWKSKLDNVLAGATPVAAVKLPLPTHHESYNPPEEYLFDEKELEEWKEMDDQDRPTNFVPQKFDKIRHIPFYDKLINERFERCLDLYLCPRVKKKKLNMTAEQLIPKIPSVDELKPFPTALNITYIGHTTAITCMVTSPKGQYLASGDKSGTLIVWEVLTSRKLYTHEFPAAVHSIDWSCHNMLLVSVGQEVSILNWPYPKDTFESNEALFEESKAAQETGKSNWEYYASDSDEYSQNLRVKLSFDADVTFVQFHSKGDYFLTVSPEEQKKNEVVVVHHLSRSASQKPFSKSHGLIKKAFFHWTKPQLLLMTNKNVHIFNLQKQATEKKLKSGAEFNSSLCLHPYGDNLVIGSEDKKLLWYDLDLSDAPYKTLEYHSKAITQVDFSRTYPLLATASNDGTVHVLHAKVFTDLLQNALIVPLKILKGHSAKDGEGVKEVKFHPTQPWVFSAGNDGKICLWT